MQLKYEIEGGNFAKAGFASSEIKKVLKQLNVDAATIKRIVVSSYEADVNIVAHAYHGKISAEIDQDKIVTRCDDEGPGIPDIEQAMQVGYSTASPEVREMVFGAGMVLPNIKKNADNMAIESEVGKGTALIITIIFQLHNHPDMLPLGNIAGVIILLTSANPSKNFLYFHRTKKGSYSFDTKDIKNELGDTPISDNSVRNFLKDMLFENLKMIDAGKECSIEFNKETNKNITREEV